MTTKDKPTRMTFYATPADQKVIQEIQELAPHYSFNHLTREGHRMVLKKLQAEAEQPIYQIKHAGRILR